MLRLIFIGLMFFSNMVSAHKPSDSYLTIKVQESHIEGQWDIAIRDLDYAMGLDQDLDGEISWGELQAHHEDISAYVFSRLKLYSEDDVCPIKTRQHLVDNHSDGAYAVIRFLADCEYSPHALTVNYNLFFDVDPQHRGLARIDYHNESDVVTQSLIFSPESSSQKLILVDAGSFRQFLDYTKMGMWHISIGFDHILFLLALLLPSVLRRQEGEWRAVTCLDMALWDVIKVVTAFTLAHSITLSLAVFKMVSLPSRWVESAIAISIVLAALNNIYPLFQGRRWVVAFVFGLIHGMGFSSILLDLGLVENSLWLALIAFNAGVEIGQMIIVMIFIPFSYWLCHSTFYQPLILRMGSFIIAVLGIFWFIERSFDIELFV